MMARAWPLESRELRVQCLFNYQIAVWPSASQESIWVPAGRTGTHAFLVELVGVMRQTPGERAAYSRYSTVLVLSVPFSTAHSPGTTVSDKETWIHSLDKG